MGTNQLNKLSGDLYNLMLYLHNKFFHLNEITKNLPMPPSHVKVIIYLARMGTSSISEVAKNLEISKPNMTPIIDKLIAQGLINRYNDPNDRRVLRIELTDKAYELIKKREEILKNNLAEKISSLTVEDLEALSKHIIGITNIISKIE
jgi:DNA-binding MarR family transcriptional regulator